MSKSFLNKDRIEEWERIKGEFRTSPNYGDLIIDTWKIMAWYYKPSMWNDYSFPGSFIADITENFYFSTNELCTIICIAIFLTALRYICEHFVCKPLVYWWNLLDINKKKFPESAWKCLFYTCTWTYCVYLVFYRYDYFDKFYLIWDDWASGMNVPFDIKVMYFVQCGFYLHSIYATIYMDGKRKDFYAMLFHHVVTLALITTSYAIRYHKIGLLVLFVHDITDIWLEGTKVLHYMATRENGEEYWYYDIAANISFIIFTFCWFLFRLYWYPLKVLYLSGVISAHRMYKKGSGLHGFFNSLLWSLLALNIYWLFFILQLLFRVCRGNLNSLQDVREDQNNKKND